MRLVTEATKKILLPCGFNSADRLSINLFDQATSFYLKTFHKYGPHYAPSFTARQGWWKRFPDRKLKRKYAGIHEHVVPVSDYSVIIINELWKKDALQFETPETKQVFETTLLKTLNDQLLADAYADFKINGTITDDAKNLIVHPNEDLQPAPYQKLACALSMRTDGYGLFMEQGTGKTLVLILRVCNEAPKVKAETGRPYNAIIVCPNPVRSNCKREFELFGTCNIKTTVIRGDRIGRIKELQNALRYEGQDANVVIVGLDTLVNSFHDGLNLINWNFAAYDESHYICNPKTKRYKAALELRDVSKARVPATGTFIANTFADLYAQFEFMGKNYSGMRNFSQFKKFFGKFVDRKKKDEENQESNRKTPEYEKKLIGLQNIPFLKERLTRKSFMISKAEALPWLPPKQLRIMEYDVEGFQAEVYTQVAQEAVFKIEQLLASGKPKQITVTLALLELLRLAQITSGYVVWDAYIDPETGLVHEKRKEAFAQNPKLDLCIDIIKQKPVHRKTVVWSCYVDCIAMISHRLQKEGIGHCLYYGGMNEDQREESVRLFNEDPNTRVIVMNQMAAAEGLNLLGYKPHHGKDYITDCDEHIWYVINYSRIKKAQGSDRSHRRGTRVPVMMTHLIATPIIPKRPSIDERIFIDVIDKDMNALEISDVREILSATLENIQNETTLLCS